MNASFQNGVAWLCWTVIMLGQAVHPTLGAEPAGNNGEARPATEVEKFLRADAEMAFDPVQIAGGIVILHGVAPTLWVRERAAEIVKGVAEVRGVVNLLVLNPVARSDDLIAQDAQQAIRWCALTHIQLAAVHDGKVVLRGQVDSVQQQERLRRTIKQISGVTGLDDQTVPRQWDVPEKEPRPTITHPDAEIRKAIAEAFLYNPRVRYPAPKIQVTNGIVTLTGNAADLISKQAAAETAAKTVGVVAIRDFLIVPWPASALDLSIQAALRRDPQLKSPQVIVTVVGSTAHLSGVVATAADRQRALRIVSGVPGVRFVETDLAILEAPARGPSSAPSTGQ